MKRLPEYFFIGPERTGTTWIHEYLSSRSDVVTPTVTKETFFFDRHFDKGVDWYLKHFPEMSAAQKVVEVAPTYFHSEQAVQRIKKYNNRAQVICTLRNPIERGYSHYLHIKRYGGTTQSLEEAVVAHPQILDASRYAKHIKRLWDDLGNQQVKFLLFDDLSIDAHEFAEQICGILEIPYLPPPDSLGGGKVNVSGEVRNPRLARLGFALRYYLRRARMFGLISVAKKLGIHSMMFGVKANGDATSWPEKELLRQKLQGEIAELEDLLGMDLQQWKGGPGASG